MSTKPVGSTSFADAKLNAEALDKIINSVYIGLIQLRGASDGNLTAPTIAKVIQDIYDLGDAAVADVEALVQAYLDGLPPLQEASPVDDIVYVAYNGGLVPLTDVLP